MFIMGKKHAIYERSLAVIEHGVSVLEGGDLAPAAPVAPHRPLPEAAQGWRVRGQGGGGRVAGAPVHQAPQAVGHVQAAEVHRHASWIISIDP